MIYSAKSEAGIGKEMLLSLGVTVTKLVTDSRSVQKGDTFVAYPGLQTDGRHYIAQAIANGANAVFWEANNFQWKTDWNIPNQAVTNLRIHAGQLANQVYGMPSERLWMVGITGTNGKTSISHWIAQTYIALGRNSALLGTLGNGFPGALTPTLNTTPDAISVHGLLAEYESKGAKSVVMEVSSHALAQGRVNGVHYDVALLSNLSRDHLDYHGDMQSYAAAKRMLFEWKHLKFAVLNLDDVYGVSLAQELQDAEVEVVGYGLEESSLQLAEQLGIRMVHGSELHMDASGLEITVRSSWGQAALKSRLLGRFNASNLLGALAVVMVDGYDLQDAVREIGKQKAVAGRMQTMGGKGQPTVVVDYAHTPDALEKVLLALREVTANNNGKLICVFGCGGDRDRGKRPMMGAVVSKFADICVVTNDNPRSEAPETIIEAIISGMSGDFYVVADRAQAIARGIDLAHAQDTVLLAGKGHEDYQEIMGVKHPFSDSEMALQALTMWKLEHQQKQLAS
jgi:UDP-N-acetylmuramoyl-L-alanyl-D-glutamate--2,6-diaminopimelate ligase